MNRLSLDDWLLAESVRLAEERSGRRSDAAAVEVARAAGGDPARRVVARAGALAEASDLRGDIARLRSLRFAAFLSLAAIGALAGVLAARAGIAEREVNILLAAAALLIVPTLMLLAWAVLALIGGRRSGAGQPGKAGLARALMGRIAPRWLGSVHAPEVIAAAGGALATPWGRWALSSAAHAFWLAYAAAAWATLAVHFSIVQYDLVWGTTLLTDDQVVALVEALIRWPELIGLMPQADPDWIAAGREGVADPSARALWARFLLAMIAAYAIVPRALLLLSSLGLAAWHARRMRLDLARPGYLRLAADLQPVQEEPAGEGPPVPEPRRASSRRRRPGAGPAVAVAVELEDASGDRSAAIPGLRLLDLGRADDRAGRRAAREAVEELDRPAAAVVAFCSMLRTPDAGSERFLGDLADAARAPLVIVLDEGDRLRARGGDEAARLSDWQALAERAGAEVFAIDRSAPDAAELARLHRALDGAPAP